MADFGLARVVLDLQGSLMTGGLGTFQWMAPEVLAHQRYSEKADVFSCASLTAYLGSGFISSTHVCHGLFYCGYGLQSFGDDCSLSKLNRMTDLTDVCACMRRHFMWSDRPQHLGVHHSQHAMK